LEEKENSMKTISIAVICLFAALALACDKKKDTTAETPAPAAAVEADAPAVLATYESIRDLLAKDKTEGLADQAGKLEGQARGAATKAGGDAKPKLEAIATAAAGLKSKAGDVDEARKAFGDVSKPMVELLEADPKLREGQHLFECPMADGYGKWVQPHAKIQNPYMGTKMLECGGKKDWSS
jgi:membrane fusion protein, copper/silver efflux system